MIVINRQKKSWAKSHAKQQCGAAANDVNGHYRKSNNTSDCSEVVRPQNCADCWIEAKNGFQKNNYLVANSSKTSQLQQHVKM